MKNIMVGAAMALALVGGQATAQEAKMDVDVITQDLGTGGSDDWVMALMAVAVLVAVLDSGGGAVVFVSDERLKTDLTRVGVSPSGLPVYQYRYKGHAQVFQGVMAQDVLTHRPDAVITGADGFYRVDYGKLDVEMKIVL